MRGRFIKLSELAVLIVVVLLWSSVPAIAQTGETFSQWAFRLPAMKGYQRFAADADGRWSPTQTDHDGANAYLFANPAKKLWLTVRRSERTISSREKAMPPGLFDINLKSELKIRGLTHIAPKSTEWSAGKASIYKLPGELAPGYRSTLLCLQPKATPLSETMYLLTVVYTDASKSEAQKLTDLILNKATVAKR